MTLFFSDPSSLPADYFKSSPKAKIEMDMRGNSEKFNQEMSQEITDPDTLIKTKVGTLVSCLTVKSSISPDLKGWEL